MKLPISNPSGGILDVVIFSSKHLFSKYLFDLERMNVGAINLGVRFLLELFSLIAMGMWGWQQTNGWSKYVLAIGLPLLMAGIWAVFNVPGDPSRSGNAPIAVPGPVRLMLEVAFFGIANWCLLDMYNTGLGMAFAITLILHYLVAYRRIKWLISK